MSQLNQPSPTIENYLSLMFILERDSEPVVGVRLAELLGVTPPTVTNTLKRMARDGLVAFSDPQGPHLTENGLVAARTVMRRHMLTEWMLAHMLSWSKAHGQAHQLEHAISDEIEAALVKEWGDPKTCPHGNPLPGYEEAVAHWIPLTNIAAGQTVIIRRVHELAEETPGLLSFLEEKGLTLGQEVLVAEVLPFNQTITLRRAEGEVSLGFALGKYMFVEPKNS
jgi:DtxR family transcriptional regulator, Mn-dependent transcriptional regulator